MRSLVLNLLNKLPKSHFDLRLNGINIDDLVAELLSMISEGYFDSNVNDSLLISPLMKFLDKGVGSLSTRCIEAFSEQTDLFRKELVLALCFHSPAGQTLFSTFSTRDRALYAGSWLRCMFNVANNGDAEGAVFLMKLYEATPKEHARLLLQRMESCRLQVQASRDTLIPVCASLSISVEEWHDYIYAN